jgi:hypothetical protein
MEVEMRPDPNMWVHFHDSGHPLRYPVQDLLDSRAKDREDGEGLDCSEGVNQGDMQSLELLHLHETESHIQLVHLISKGKASLETEILHDGCLT